MVLAAPFSPSLGIRLVVPSMRLVVRMYAREYVCEKAGCAHVKMLMALISGM